MTQFHGGTKLPRTLHKGTAPKPSPTHGGSGASKGILHAAPTKPIINAANYGAQKLKRAK
jgi:hypothetical protein